MFFMNHLLATTIGCISILLVLYGYIILLATIPQIQRRLLYSHKPFGLFSSSCWGEAALDKPESEGFLPGQVTSHYIDTLDGERLHSWLVLPLAAYRNCKGLNSGSYSSRNGLAHSALELLRSDTKAVVILYLHGNGNNIGTENRCAAYRNLTSISKHIYVLALEYRGFGKSTGSPTEEGLIMDAMCARSWIEKELGVPSERILLMGQSLGCAVAAGLLHRAAETRQLLNFAGVVLCSGFTDVATVAFKYRFFGMVPLFVPMTWSQWSRTWFASAASQDNWSTESRLKGVVRGFDSLCLSIIHARDDYFTPFEMAETLYHACVNEMRNFGTVAEDQVAVEGVSHVKEATIGGKRIRRVLLDHGGHNTLVKWDTVAYEVQQLLTAAKLID